MIEVYLIILGAPTATWVGPMDSMSAAKALNEKIGGRGYISTVDVKFRSPTPTSGRIVSPSNFRKGLAT